MARRRGKKFKGVVSNKKSKLVAALETGKSIKGMKGFVNLEDSNCEPLFVPVVVEGLKTEGEDADYCSCGELKIAAVVEGTKSKITFKVDAWADDMTVVDLNTEKALAIRQAEKELSLITNHHLLVRKRLALESYVVDHLRDATLKDYKLNLEEEKVAYKSMSDPNIRRYAKIAVCMANGIQPDEASYTLQYKND